MADDSFNSSGGFKRSLDDDGGNDGGSIKRFKSGEGPNMELRVLVLSKNAGAIIGKGGTNIKRLRSEYTPSVMVPDSLGPERILSMTAPVGTICACMRDIIPTLEDYQQYSGRDDFDCEVRILFHHSLAGGIIGRAGFKIKELREQTKTNIKVFQSKCPGSTDRVCAVQGKLDNVIDAIGLIFDTIKDSPVKGQEAKYVPGDDFEDAESYGGFTFEDMARGGRGGRGGGRGRGGRGGPRGGFGGGGGGFRDGGMRGGRFGGGGGGGRGRMNDSFGGGFGGGRQDRFGGGNRGSGGRDFGGGGGGMRGGGFDGGFQSNFASDSGMGDSQGMMFQQLKDQVTIPTDCAGSIIGRGGERIRSIRANSGAGITIDEPLPNTNERVITIQGSESQITKAKFLLKQAAMEKQGGSRY